MKTYAPKGLHGAQLRALMASLGASPVEVSKYLKVTERSVWRWLSDDSAPYAALAALWHETPEGRHAASVDVGNEARLMQGLARATGEALKLESARLLRVLAICETGAANDPFVTGPGGPGGFPPRPTYAYEIGRLPCVAVSASSR